MSLVAAALPQVECFLDAAAGQAGLGALGYQEQVRERLDLGRRNYGDSSFQLSLEQIAGELDDEAADLAGWGVVALLSDDLAGRDEEQCLKILGLLQSIGAEGARVAFLVRELKRTLEHSHAG
jgi:hypothetical protein